MQGLIDLVSHHAHWTMALVFATAMAESVAIVGLFVPGTAILVGIGSVAGLGGVALWQVTFFAIAGAIAGDGISYWLGHRYKEHIRTVWPLTRRPDLLTSAETYFLRHGAKSVFVGRFVPAVRAMIPLVAGIAGMTPRRFYAANVLSALVWGPAHILPGAALGFGLDALNLSPAALSAAAAGVVAAMVLGGWLLHRGYGRGG